VEIAGMVKPGKNAGRPIWKMSGGKPYMQSPLILIGLLEVFFELIDVCTS